MAEKITSSAGKALKLGEPAGRGGEATVYRIHGQTERLAKIYARPPRPEYVDKLTWMTEHPPENPTQRYGHASLAWPEELLYGDRKRLVGYSMPFIQGAVSVLEVFNPRRRAVTLPDFDSRYLHRSARNLAAALGALHREGYVVGDLNESNVLVTPSALVTMIDVDSFQVEEQRPSGSVVHYCPVGKPEYTPPELQGKALDQVQRRPEHDTFSLGVLIFQLLMDGNHPFRAQWLGKGEPPPLEQRIALGAFPYALKPPVTVKPPHNAPGLERLHPALADLMRRCFETGHNNPQQRPTPADWERAIAAAETALVTCPERHVYAGHLDACPHCATEAHRAAIQAAQRAAGRGKKPRSSGRPPNASPRPRPAAAPPRNPAPQPRANTKPAAGKASGRAAGRAPAGSKPGGWWQRKPPAPQTAPAAPTAGPARPAQSPPPSSGSPSSGPVVGARVAKWVVRSVAQSLPSSGQGGSTAGGAAPRRRSFTESFVWNLMRNSPMVAQGGAASQPPVSQPPAAQPTSSGQPSTSSSAPQAANPVPRPATWGGASGQTVSRPRPIPLVISRPRLSLRTALKSLTNGSGIGALTGVGASATLALAGGALDYPIGWLVLLALGGAFGALARGWQPGVRSGEWITIQMGWKRFLQITGLLIGATLGLWLTRSVIWLICPSVLALAAGGYFGRLAGRKLWEVGRYWDWERIWAGASAATAAIAGALILRWLGTSLLGLSVQGQELADLVKGLAPWVEAETGNLALGWLATGALAGAIGGAVSGFVTDFFARLLGLAQ